MDEQHSANALSTLSSLVGTWRGQGTARLPSMDAVEFAEAIRAESTSISLAATGAKLRQAIWRYDLTGDLLAYDISIATVDFALTAHISAELHRSESRSG